MKTDLFDRYVHEVGRRLPRRMRADVETELRSLLADALQDRQEDRQEARQEGRQEARQAERGAVSGATLESLQVAILEEFGPPAKMAARYTPPQRHLIGPRLFHLYGIVVAAVMGSLTLAHLILLGLVLWGHAESFEALLPSLLGMAGSYLNAMLTAFAAVTLTFAVLERVLPRWALDEDENEDEEPWSPRSLPEIHDPTRIEPGRLIVEIGLIGFALLVFNFLPDWVGLGFVGTVNGGPVRWHPVPLLSPAFFSAYLPFLDVLWLLTIGLNLVLLRQGRWQQATRLVDLLLAVFQALIVYRMLTGPAILSMEAIPGASLRELLDSILSTLLQIGLIAALIGTAVEAARKLVRILRVPGVPFDGARASS